MVSLAKTPQEMQKDAADMPMSVASNKVSGPEYPYGCCISLDDETLDKTGLGGDIPAAGETIHITAMAKVTCASVRDEIGTDSTTKQCRRVELQITDMDVMGNPVEDQIAKSDARRKRFYGGDDDGDED